MTTRRRIAVVMMARPAAGRTRTPARYYMSVKSISNRYAMHILQFCPIHPQKPSSMITIIIVIFITVLLP
jgi:hypothetical protein